MMKKINNDIINLSHKIGEETSRIAEAAQTDIAYNFADILNEKKTNDISNIETKTKKLFKSSLEDFPRVSKDLLKNSKSLFKNSIEQAKILQRIDKENKIKEYLFKITGDQLLANQKIRYKNGRMIGFKEFTEMSTRTRIQHELLESQKKVGDEVKQLFYLCDTYSDCANDHRDFQGKLYYSAKIWRKISRKNPNYSKIKRGIERCKSSVEDVTQKAPFLCTRPNCRHRLIPLGIDEVVAEGVKTLLKKNEADKGAYSTSIVKKNYDDSQKQRAIELNIRKAKRNLEIMNRSYNRTKDLDYLNAANRSKKTIRNLQFKMRKLMNSNKTLKRDYRRENPYHLQKDLGVAYNSQPVRVAVQVPDVDILPLEKRQNNKAFIVYKQGDTSDLTKDDTTIIFNDSIQVSGSKSKYKIIIPPNAQDQVNFDNGKITIKENSIFDVIGQKKGEFTLLMREKL